MLLILEILIKIKNPRGIICHIVRHVALCNRYARSGITSALTNKCKVGMVLMSSTHKFFSLFIANFLCSNHHGYIVPEPCRMI